MSDYDERVAALAALGMEWWDRCTHGDLTVPPGLTLTETDWGHELRGAHGYISLQQRPKHCDRGRYLAQLSDDGAFGIEPIDGWQYGRFYMDQTRALQECIDWLAYRESRVDE